MVRGKNKKNKSRKGQGRTVFQRDPLGAENDVNKGDLVRIPAGWSQPRLANQTYKISRTVNGADISQIAAATVMGSYNFKLSDLPTPTDFTNLFDQYKLVAAKIKFRPRFNMATVTNITAAIFPRLLTVIDYDDSTNLTVITDALQYQTLKETRFDQDHVRLLKPRMALAAYGAGVFTAFANQGNQWIDVASTTVEHYGVKFIIEAGVVGQTSLQTWAVEIEYFFEFRQTR